MDRVLRSPTLVNLKNVPPDLTFSGKACSSIYPTSELLLKIVWRYLLRLAL